MCSLLQICVQYCIDVAYVVEIKLNSIQFNYVNELPFQRDRNTSKRPAAGNDVIVIQTVMCGGHYSEPTRNYTTCWRIVGRTCDSSGCTDLIRGRRMANVKRKNRDRSLTLF